MGRAESLLVMSHTNLFAYLIALREPMNVNPGTRFDKAQLRGAAALTLGFLAKRRQDIFLFLRLRWYGPAYRGSAGFLLSTTHCVWWFRQDVMKCRVDCPFSGFRHLFLILFGGQDRVGEGT